nr:MAG TPA: hypothetical protein [Caudoviricetes sp.]
MQSFNSGQYFSPVRCKSEPLHPNFITSQITNPTRFKLFLKINLKRN